MYAVMVLYCLCVLLVFFFFKQKTAYEMRISDWSSDVCSSDLARQWLSGFGGSAGTLVVTTDFAGLWTDSRYWEQADSDLADTGIRTMRAEIGRASCRERVCQYV